MPRAAVVALHGVGDGQLEEAAAFGRGQDLLLLLGRELVELLACDGAREGFCLRNTGPVVFSKPFVETVELTVNELDDPGL